MDQPEHEAQESDGAEQAFVALREEVAALRRGVELVYRQGQEPKGPVAAGTDYSPTLGAIAKELKAVAARLDAIERAPALAITPAQQAGELRRELHYIGQDARGGLAHSQAELDGTVRELRGMIDSARAWQRSAAMALDGGRVRGHGRRAVVVPADGHAALGRRHLAGGPGLWRTLERGRGDDAGCRPRPMGADGAALQGVP